MAAVSFSGIASGIDTESLIKATLDSSRAIKVTPSQNKVTEISAENDALETFKEKLNTLKDKIQPFRAIGGGVIVRNATSSDDSVATAIPGSGASNASYNLTVSQLAEPGRIVFPNTLSTLASTTSAIGVTTSGTLRFTFNTPVASEAVNADISVTTTTTVAEFASLLNSNSTFAQYADATIINVGTPTTPAYRLAITAKKTGEGISGQAIDFSLLTAVMPAPTETDGTNSKVTIAGIGTNIERSTNDITDIIPGLTFSLKDTGTTKLTVAVDVTATTSRIQDFVEAFNDVVSYIQESNTVTRQESGKEVSNTFGPLAKTSLDENALAQLRTDLTKAKSTTGTKILILADLGLTTDSGAYNAATKTGGGTLKLDSDAISSALGRTLSNALALEPDSVQEIFETFGESAGNVVTGTIAQYVNFNKLLDFSINSNKTQISDLNTRISEAEKALSNQENLLKTRYARLESLMGNLQAKGNTLSSALAGLR